MGFAYSKLLKPVLFQMDPEFIHNRFTDFGEVLGKTAMTRKLISLIYEYKGAGVSKVVDGLTYDYPILLAAGFDYNARLTEILHSMSFGGVEVGSVTYNSYEGNQKPRLTRLKKNRSIIVNKGLKSQGAQKIIERLKKRQSKGVLGVSIAKTNAQYTVDTEAGTEDYYNCLKLFVDEKVGDYYTINISCPNVFAGKGETHANPKALEPLMKKIFTIDGIGKDSTTPVYIKMPISLSPEDFDGLLKILNEFPVNGLIIGNLQKDYDKLTYRDEAPRDYRGGLSGAPCFHASNDLIKRTRDLYQKRFTIMGVGGILSPEDAVGKMNAGADLVQLITGMMFTGPDLMRKICKKISDQ